MEEKAEPRRAAPGAPFGIPIDEKVKDHDEQFEFDTGIKSWLQVLGAFFLWFNSW
jgi:hypothetical protein